MCLGKRGYFEARFAHDPGPYATVLSSAAVDLLEGALPTDELKDTKEAVLEHERRRKGPHTTAPDSSGSSKARRVGRLKAVPEYEEYTVKHLSQYLPAVAGCTMRRDGKRFMGWQVFYPRPSPPFSTSLVWNELTTERQAAMHCLMWAWRCHTEATGEECPFTFE